MAHRGADSYTELHSGGCQCHADFLLLTSVISLQQSCSACQLPVITFTRLFCFISLQALHNKYNYSFLNPGSTPALQMVGNKEQEESLHFQVLE